MNPEILITKKIYPFDDVVHDTVVSQTSLPYNSQIMVIWSYHATSPPPYHTPSTKIPKSTYNYA